MMGSVRCSGAESSIDSLFDLVSDYFKRCQLSRLISTCGAGAAQDKLEQMKGLLFLYVRYQDSF